jgi:hypothetical protein
MQKEGGFLGQKLGYESMIVYEQCLAQVSACFLADVIGVTTPRLLNS